MNIADILNALTTIVNPDLMARTRGGGGVAAAAVAPDAPGVVPAAALAKQAGFPMTPPMPLVEMPSVDGSRLKQLSGKKVIQPAGATAVRESTGRSGVRG